MAINVKGVLAGGLVAGLIINISAVLMVPVVGNQMEEALEAGNLPPMGGGAMAYFGVMSLVVGVVLGSLSSSEAFRWAGHRGRAAR